MGVLDKWTPTVNVLQTLIAQISFHIAISTKIPCAGSYQIYHFLTERIVNINYSIIKQLPTCICLKPQLFLIVYDNK